MTQHQTGIDLSNNINVVNTIDTNGNSVIIEQETERNLSKDEWITPRKMCRVENILSIIDECSNKYEILSKDDDDILDMVTVESVTEQELNDAGDRFKETGDTRISHETPGKANKMSDEKDDVNSQIENLVNLWRGAITGEEYHVVTRRLSCLHRLTQIHEEVCKALKVHSDHKGLALMKEDVELLRREVIRTDNADTIHDATVRSEVMNCRFGIIVHALSFKEKIDEHIKSDSACEDKEHSVKDEDVMPDGSSSLNEVLNSISTGVNETENSLERHNKTKLESETETIPENPNDMNDSVTMLDEIEDHVIDLSVSSNLCSTEIISINQKPNDDFSEHVVMNYTDKPSEMPSNSIDIDGTDECSKKGCEDTEMNSDINAISNSKSTTEVVIDNVERTMDGKPGGNNDEVAEKKTTSKYYNHFIEQVTVFKDYLRDDIEGCKFKMDDK